MEKDISTKQFPFFFSVVFAVIIERKVKSTFNSENAASNISKNCEKAAILTWRISALSAVLLLCRFFPT
jgi:hypothetical protein